MIHVAAPPYVVEHTMRTADLGASRTVRILLRLRGMRTDALRLEQLQRSSFRLLADEPGREVVLGLIGRPWTPGGGLCRFDAVDFAGFDEPGYAKAAWNLHVTRLEDGTTRLETETRVRCTDAGSRRRFRTYWFFIRLFSGLIRRLALRTIKRAAESAHS